MTSFQFLPGTALRSKQKHLKPCIALHSYDEPAHQERSFDISHIRLHDFCKFDNYTLCLCKQYIISFKIYRGKTRNDYDFASLPHLANFIVYLQIALETEQE